MKIVLPPDRPKTSTEILRDYGRKATPVERANFSAWRNANLDAFLSEADARRRQQLNEQYRYLPASYRAMDELVEALGQEHADLIRALIETMIAERHE